MEDISFEDFYGPSALNSPLFLLDPFIGCKNSTMESSDIESSDAESSDTESSDTELDNLFEDIHGPTVFKGPKCLLGPFIRHKNSDMESSDTEMDSCLMNENKIQGTPFALINVQIKPDHENADLTSELSIKNQEAYSKLIEDHSVVYDDAENQDCIEITPCLVEKDEDEKQCSLFAPFSHQLKPDPEYTCLVSERLALNQEATTKLINDRYKWIMESAAMRKVKELSIGEYAKRYEQYSKINDFEEVEKTNPFLHKAFDDSEGTTQLLHNLHISPDSFAKDNLEEANINQHEVAYGLNRFLKLKAVEVNTEATFSNFDVLKTDTLHYEHSVEDALMSSSNEQKDGEKLTLQEVSQEVGSKKYTETNQTFYKGISSVCDNLLIEKSESHCE